MLCSSIAKCAAEFQQHDLPLHCLINNIGVESPEDEEAEHGFDVSLLLQMSCCLSCNELFADDLRDINVHVLQATQAINYLGAFYMTHLLLQQLNQSRNSRILNLTSLVEPTGSIDWDDLG